jgi:hypothetical protein
MRLLRLTLLVLVLALTASTAARAQEAAPGASGGAAPTAPDPAPAENSQAPSPSTGAVTLGRTNLRSRPGGGGVLRKLRAGTPVRAICTQVGGLVVTRRDGPSRVWVRVRAGRTTGYLHDALVNPKLGMLLAPLCGVRAATGRGLPGVVQGACAIKPPVKLIAPFATPQSFIEAVLPGARQSNRTNQVPVSVTLAQAILETGAGKSSTLGNNYFGIKARASAKPGEYVWGPNAVGCTLVKTREAERAGLVLTTGAFRAYGELRTSVLDHGALLRGNSVYAPAFRYTDQPKRFLREIAKRYATDPAYAAKLLRLIDQYELLEYDD